MSQPKTILQSVAAVILWLMTVGPGHGGRLLRARDLLRDLCVRLSNDTAPALFWGDVLVVLAADRFRRRSSSRPASITGNMSAKRKSWRLFAWSLAVGLAIPFIALVLGGSA